MKMEYYSGNSQQLFTFYDNSLVTTIHQSQLFISHYQSLPFTIHQSLGNGEWGMASVGMRNGQWENVPDSIPLNLAGNEESGMENENGRHKGLTLRVAKNFLLVSSAQHVCL